MSFAAPGLVFWGEHYGGLAMRVCQNFFFLQVPSHILLLRPNQAFAFSVTTAPKCQVSNRSLEAQLVP